MFTFLISLFVAVLMIFSTNAVPLHSPFYMETSNITLHSFRLPPNADLVKEIYEVVSRKNITAGSITTCVGSLTQVNIRFANQPNGTVLNGHFEIVSLVGMMSSVANVHASPNGHLHISVGTEKGNTISGHLVGGTVYTTAEISILQYNDLVFDRVLDRTFGYYELAIFPRYK